VVSFSVVGLGGSVEPHSQSELALKAVLSALGRRDVDTRMFSGPQLNFPPYHTGAEPPAGATDYLAAVRSADAVVISSPGYHGTVSGLVKNALDYLEELRTDQRPYLDGRPVGLIAVARGWQAAVSTLTTLRQITHALRGWPAPFGLTVNSAVTTFDEFAKADSPQISDSIEVLADQIASWPGRR
jgi:FMN reductase